MNAMYQPDRQRFDRAFYRVWVQTHKHAPAEDVVAAELSQLHNRKGA
ncbi:hypothetical protein ACIBF6_14330 [Streptosporangium amethystogenes]